MIFIGGSVLFEFVLLMMVLYGIMFVLLAMFFYGVIFVLLINDVLMLLLFFVFPSYPFGDYKP